MFCAVDDVLEGVEGVVGVDGRSWMNGVWFGDWECSSARTTE